MLGYGGGFIGPLMIGWTLDLANGRSMYGWGFAFGTVSLLMAAALIAFVRINPDGLAGDRKSRD
jgi:hypothetical protein